MEKTKNRPYACDPKYTIWKQSHHVVSDLYMPVDFYSFKFVGTLESDENNIRI